VKDVNGGKKMRVAFVYGSMAGGSEQSDSDVDLMVIGTVTALELAMPLRRARELLGRDVNPTVCTPVEFERKRAGKDHFLTNVLDKPRLLMMRRRGFRTRNWTRLASEPAKC
jgi:predicted nucleotidyltransferase